jgi:hypothetical protein
MLVLKKETISKLEEAIDAIETELGEIEGLEIKVEHKIDNGEKETFATIKSFVVYYLHKQEIELK